MNKNSPNGSLDIWEDVLKKNVKSNLLRHAATVPQKDPPYDIQIFELLVAESLNLQDQHTKWKVTQASHDHGVDLLGEDDAPCRTPFTTSQYRLLSVGQVKRSKRSYKYEDFRIDIRKARGYWLSRDLFQGHSPKQFVFVLSTEGKNGVKVLQKHLEKDLAHNTDIQLKNDQFAQIQLIDASLIMKSWKLNLNYFEYILEEALSPEQMACFHEYISGLDDSWITISISAPDSGGIGEPVVQTLLIETPSDELSLSLRIRWIAPASGGIQLLHPLRMIDPRFGGYTVRIRGRAEIPIVLRSLQDGLCDFGAVELSSEENQPVAAAPLKALKICSGFSPLYYSSPNRSTLQELEVLAADESPMMIPAAVSGFGGIGKSSLISEVMVNAVQHGFFAIDIQQPKDLMHPKFLLHRLFLQILRPHAPRNMFLPDLPAQAKTYLGCNYREEWETELQSYFQNDSQPADAVMIAECLVSLLLTALRESRIFVWLSNLHWASKETLDILRIAMEELSANQDMLQNRIIWIVEGRCGETLTYDGQTYYPIYWEQFLNNHLLRHYTLRVWGHEESLEFLRQLFVDPGESRPLYEAYYEKLLSCAGGVPMHILELVRIQVEQELLVPDPGQMYRLRIARFQSDRTSLSASILEMVGHRIAFYRRECSDFIDFCAILAALDDSIPPLLANRLMKRLHTDYPGIDGLLVRSGFLTRQGKAYHFCHEHYQAAFRMQRIKNHSILAECFSYYDQLPRKRARDRFEEIRLRLLEDDAAFAQVRRDILALLRCKIPKSMEQSLYKLLLDLPPLPEGRDLSTCKVLFLLAETFIREGSWRSAQDYLEKLLALPRGNDTSELLLHIKAYQELSNILGDRLLFDQAIRTAEDGLELAEVTLERHLASSKQYASVCVEYEKLLARLAVCYWFAGDIARGFAFQRHCYDSAVRRGDRYSAAHVLYEIGTSTFHFNLGAGIAIMEAVLRECASIPPLERHERTLIETQLLMGKLLLAAQNGDGAGLKEVRLECRRLLERNAGSPHSYEKFLCLTMRGICVFLEERDTAKARDFFFESLRCAVESDMPNLKWKALLHAAQMSALLNDKNAEAYAKEAKNCIEGAIVENARLRDGLARMFAQVLARLDALIACTALEPLMPDGEVLPMISLMADNCLFVIMN